MNQRYPPIITLPEELPDETVVKLLDFLYQLAKLLESHYGAQLHRYYHRPDERQADLWDDTDPPF